MVDGFHFGATAPLSGSWTSRLVCLDDAKISTASNDSLDAAFGNYAFHDDVVVNEAARLELGDARINKFSAYDPTKSLHCHREETARVGVEVGGETIGIGIGVEGRTDKRVTFVVNCLTATLTDACLSALAFVHDALVRGTEDGRPRRSERDERKRNGCVLYSLKSGAKDANGVAAIDLGTVGTLLGQPIAAGLQVLVSGEFTGARIGAGHCQSDRAAALGKNFLHK